MNTEKIFCRLAIAAAVATSFTFLSSAQAGGSSDYKSTAPQPERAPIVERMMEPSVGLVDLSVGYNYIHLDDSGPLTENLHGVDASAFFNLTSWLSLGGDFMANFGHDDFSGADVDTQFYFYLFGPRVSFRPNPHWRIFFEALAGGVHANADVDSSFGSGSASEDGFAGAAGGGVDWWLSDHFALRLIQADYLPSHLGSDWQHNFRVSTGIVFSFGHR